MSIEIGGTIPHARLKVLDRDGLYDITTEDLFRGRRVALFAVPGAFTPTCSDKHLPGFVTLADSLKAKGVERIVCVAVNDPFVMRAWGDAHGAGDKVMMVSDGNAELAGKLGLAFDATDYCMGWRCERFSMLVEDGRVRIFNREAKGTFQASSAETLLSQL